MVARVCVFEHFWEVEPARVSANLVEFFDTDFEKFCQKEIEAGDLSVAKFVDEFEAVKCRQNVRSGKSF